MLIQRLSKLVVILGILAALTFAVASANTGPAEVIRIEEDACAGPWFDSDGNFVTLTVQTAQIVISNDKNGNAMLWCRGNAPFGQEDLATIDQACGFFAGALGGTPEDYCNGNGTLIITHDNTGFQCFADGFLTTSFRAIHSPGGRVHVSCNFNPSGS